MSQKISGLAPEAARPGHVMRSWLAPQFRALEVGQTGAPKPTSKADNPGNEGTHS